MRMYIDAPGTATPWASMPGPLRWICSTISG